MTEEIPPNQENKSEQDEVQDELEMQVDEHIEEPASAVFTDGVAAEEATNGEAQKKKKEKENSPFLDENLLPTSVVMRIAKGAIGDGAAINKEAKEALVRCCTGKLNASSSACLMSVGMIVFVNYLTATASVHSDPKSKTIGVEHVNNL